MSNKHYDRIVVFLLQNGLQMIGRVSMEEVRYGMEGFQGVVRVKDARVLQIKPTSSGHQYNVMFSNVFFMDASEKLIGDDILPINRESYITYREAPSQMETAYLKAVTGLEFAGSATGRTVSGKPSV